MRSYRSILLILAGIALLAISFLSCSDPVSYQAEPERTATIRPLTVGNQWFGTIIRFSQGVPYDTVRTNHTVIGDTTIADVMWSHMFNDSDDTSQFAFSYSTFLRNDSLGQWETLALGSPENLLAKYPATLLDSFAIYQDDTSQVVVTSVDTMLAFPAGNFSCYNYRYSLKLSPTTYLRVSYFFSPGVGKIKSELYESRTGADTSFYLDTSWELDSFNLVTPE